MSYVLLCPSFRAPWLAHCSDSLSYPVSLPTQPCGCTIVMATKRWKAGFISKVIGVGALCSPGMLQTLVTYMMGITMSGYATYGCRMRMKDGGTGRSMCQLWRWNRKNYTGNPGWSTASMALTWCTHSYAVLSIVPGLLQKNLMCWILPGCSEGTPLDR